MKRQNNAAWLFLIPSAVILAFVGVVPLVAVFNYSFHDIFSLDQAYWIGSQWYEEIAGSQRFRASLARSLSFSALVISVQFSLGIWIALLLSRAPRYRTPVLMLMAVPLVVPWNMIPIMWLNLINPETGLVGRVFEALGIGFDYKFTALHTWILLIVMDTWHWLGLVVILVYAGLSGIPPAYYQAAAIDGASRLQVFRHVQLPRLAGVLSMALVLRFVDSFMIYTEAFRINAGGPSGATTFLALDLGENINGFSYGIAAARSVIYFLMVLAVAWVFRLVTQAREGAGQ
ncbi:sugar ABC transporter permease [Tabrizicola sp. J26]|uniref:carbohydrate ABC transporter permease n=1 Tax=Alitabrizicola rongguiensis TaxID=2909234 RepID=UPI001F1FF8C5|nr:sugar ABC transporter permease [Tabrizicola rongguiensis]MCF1708186.1 sugar ABC transporter permease [Tabrizicola rongguiensis]